MTTSRAIRFLLAHQPIELIGVSPNLTVLQFLRAHQHLTGSKEGCASGDCGACSVVVAQLQNEQLVYQTINACIAFVGSLHGKQLITVEHLKQSNKLHDVQQALVDNHGSQCGFCTPGFVMSSFALSKKHPEPNREQVLEALAGNLCRCTGYRSIVDACMTPCGADEFDARQAQTIAALKAIDNAAALDDGMCRYYAPRSVKALADYLLKHPQARLLAGGTDLGLEVTQQLATLAHLVSLNDVAELKTVEEAKTAIHIGAAARYCDFTELLGKHYPELGAMIERIGSLQIRNAGTLGGNIGNASPIGDMPPPLIALGAELTLQQGENKRTMAVEDFYHDYKVTDLKPGEFIASVSLPKLKASQFLKVYKISKRIDDDISAVLAAIFIELDGDKINAVRIAFGGMAAIPKRALQCEQALAGKCLNQQTVNEAKVALEQDFSPMSDVRASAAYRMLVAQNLLQKCFIELTQPQIETSVVTYA